MKKIWIGIAVFSVAVLVFGAASFAYAQSRTPSPSDYPHGPWMMGEYEGYAGGMMGFGHMGWNSESGPMHEFMVASLAEALALSPEEIEERHDAGETLWEIAAAEGLSDEEIQDLMDSAHDDALEQAVASGWLSEEQAEWMDDHMEQMWSGENGFYGQYGHGNHCGGRFAPTTSDSNQN